MKRFIDNWGLPLIVLFTGTCVLVVEIVATRILSPYFGNTIFTVSSVISSVLAALSVGYFYGGRLADKRPEADMFFALVLASGISVMIIHPLMATVLPFLGAHLSLMMGPLVSSLALFFIPAVIMGTLSPYAVKLQSLLTPERGMGTIAGTIFFWSTLGSIAGGLLAGFVLIPLVGIKAIILGVGAALTLLGGALLAGNAAFKKKHFRRLAAAGLCIALVTTGHAVSMPPEEGALYVRDGTYERIKITTALWKKRIAHILNQDYSIGGGMFPGTYALAFDYTKYYSLYKIFTPDVKNALFIGGGAYSMPKALWHAEAGAHVEVAEIEPTLFDLGKQFFEVPESTRLVNILKDGRRALQDSDKTYDFIFSDVYYSTFSIPSHFTTVEFFETAKAKLAGGGVFLANLTGDMARSQPSFLLSQINTFAVVFPNYYLFAVESPAAAEAQNFILVGYNSDKIIDFTAPEILNSDDEIIRNLHRHKVDMDRFALSGYLQLTDDYTPTEYLNMGVLKRRSRSKDKTVDGDEMAAVLAQQDYYRAEYPAPDADSKTRRFLAAEMQAMTPEEARQENGGILARFAPKNKNRVVVGAYYDTAGGAVLAETARFLANTKDKMPVGVDIVLLNDAADTAAFMQGIYEGDKPTRGIMLDVACAGDTGGRNALADAGIGNVVMIEKMLDNCSAGALEDIGRTVLESIVGETG